MGVVVSFFSNENITIPQVAQRKANIVNNSSNTTFNKPKFYKKLEGPVFTTLDYNKIYATRHYQATVWVSTIEKVDKDITQAWKRGKQRLLKYFQGSNKSKYAMINTCPILLKMQKSRREQCEQNMGDDIMLSMPIPDFFSEDPPAPNRPDMFIHHGAKRIVYTGYFNKEWKQDNMYYDTNLLEIQMRHNGDNYNDEFHYLAIYDINSRNLKVNYYEYWFEGNVLETDYTCLQNFMDSEEEDAVNLS